MNQPNLSKLTKSSQAPTRPLKWRKTLPPSRRDAKLPGTPFQVGVPMTSWLVTTVFLVLVAGLTLLNQPNAMAQVETLSTPTPVVSPVTSPIESVAGNVRRLLETQECIGCNLAGAVLKDTNLQAFNLERANLQKADLERANLEGTNLQATNLRGADLGKVNLAGANLAGADLFDADLEKANLQLANLQGANLQKADLEKTNLTGANLQGANLRGADWEDAIGAEGLMIQ